MTLFHIKGEPEAAAVAFAVSSTLQVAMDVAYGRATEPNSFPIMPPTGVGTMLARKLLADLLDAGLVPDGWETAYFEGVSAEVRDPWQRSV